MTTGLPGLSRPTRTSPGKTCAASWPCLRIGTELSETPWLSSSLVAQGKSTLSPSKAAVARSEKARLREMKKRQEEELERVRAMQNEAVGSDTVRFPPRV